jgi:hypothetical protein
MIGQLGFHVCFKAAAMGQRAKPRPEPRNHLPEHGPTIPISAAPRLAVEINSMLPVRHFLFPNLLDIERANPTA